MKFPGVFLLALAGLAASYLTMVRVVDARAAFGDPLKPRLFPTVRFDSRMEKLRLFHAYQQAGTVTGLTLGSSRSMKLDPAQLDRRSGLRFFNFGVDSALVEDYLAIYRWAKAQGARPRLLLIGLDIEALHNDDKPDERFERNPVLQAALGTAPPSRAGWGPALAREALRLKSTLDIAYWKDTRRALSAWLRSPKPDEIFSRLEPNGYLRYPKWEWERASGRFDLARQVESSTGYIGFFKTMTGLSPQREGRLEQLITEAQAERTEVRIWITELHPAIMRRLEQQTRYRDLHDSTWRYLRSLKSRFGIEVFDFSRPEQFEGSVAGWYDGAHIDESNAALVTARLMGGRP